MTKKTAREIFKESYGAQAIGIEHSLLQIGREYLPEVARLVLDGEALTTGQAEEYYAWVLEGVRDQEFSNYLS